MIRSDRKYPLHIYLSALFVSLIVVFSAVTIALQYWESRRMLLASADAVVRHIEGEIRETLQGRYDAATLAADLLATTRLTEVHTLQERLERLPILAQLLKDGRGFSAVYVGYTDGDWILIAPPGPSVALPQSQKIPPDTAFLVQSRVKEQVGQGDSRVIFVNAQFQPIADRAVPNFAYDPRERPWFREAMASGGVVITEPYLFFDTREPGTTVARRSADSRAVAAVDITLQALSEMLAGMRPTPSARLVLLNGDGAVVADSDGGSQTAAAGASEPHLPRLDEIRAPGIAELFAARASAGSQMRRIEHGGEAWDGFISALAQPGPPLYLAVAAPQRELLAGAERIRNRSILVSLALLAIAALCTYALARIAGRALLGLTREAATVRALKFDAPVMVRSFIAEIDTLARTMASMKETIRRFLSIGATLAGERQFDRLLERILTETMRIASARGGVIHLAEGDSSLKTALVRWDDDNLASNEEPPDPVTDPTHPLGWAMRDGAGLQPLSGDQVARYFPQFGYREALAVFCVPLRNRRGETLGVLTLARPPQPSEDAAERDVLALVEAVSGTAAAALDAQRLVQEQKRLLEAFIELVAGAIDRKSPYTGGHCQRVPELTKMLARAAECATDGPFKDFALSAEQWEELHIAAWLHDCGKVTSPEFVVDKATKLETIYDRLHEIRMRFEVLKREAEVASWQAIAAGADRDRTLDELRTVWDTLDREFAFVAQCNRGGESITPQKIEELKRIGRRRWTRTLDDRIGISEDDRRRKARLPVEPLPASEPLLADKPEHIVERPETDRLAADNPWGFKVDMPEALYNRGELYNLSIGRGTLTREDRFKINEHIIETIRMLSRLPFPHYLGNVVEIAGGHHEKMDGTGYPRRLRREEMSVLARMMAIADIFEALTAVDRPYKQGKTLSESLAIMARMRDEAHIDPDLFELFLSAEVYREFADKYLSRKQIDPIDPERYQGPAATLSAAALG